MLHIQFSFWEFRVQKVVCLLGLYMFWSTVNADSQGKTRFSLSKLKIKDTTKTV